MHNWILKCKYTIKLKHRMPKIHPGIFSYETVICCILTLKISWIKLKTYFCWNCKTSRIYRLKSDWNTLFLKSKAWTSFWISKPHCYSLVIAHFWVFIGFIYFFSLWWCNEVTLIVTALFCMLLNFLFANQIDPQCVMNCLSQKFQQMSHQL